MDRNLLIGICCICCVALCPDNSVCDVEIVGAVIEKKENQPLQVKTTETSGGKLLISSVLDYGADPTGKNSSSEAFDAALSANTVLYIPPGIYRVNKTIVFDNKRIFGSNALGRGATGVHSTIVGDKAMPKNDPIIAMGRSSVLEHVEIKYEPEAITGKEGVDERVGILTKGGQYVLQRGGSIRNVRVENVGTAISDKGHGVFSVTFDTIEIGSHSYAGVHLRGKARTGNVWSNIYISDHDTYTPLYGFNLEGQEAGGWITQLNVEHSVYQESAIRFSGCASLSVGSLHVEGVDLSKPDRGYLEVNESSIIIDSLNILNTRMSQDQTYVVKLGGSSYKSPETGSAAFSNTNLLRIQIYHTKGLNVPDRKLYPEYPDERRFLMNVRSFEHFHRDSSHKDKYKLYVGMHTWLLYPEEIAMVDYMENAINIYSNSGKNIIIDSL